MTNPNDVVVPGIVQAAAGAITNSFGTLVDGAVNGIEIDAAGSINNGGDISGALASGVFIAGAGTVNNLGAATIHGGIHGVVVVADGTVNNAGDITGAEGVGVFIGGAGAVDNAAGANIAGAIVGIDIVATGTLHNAGSILGTQGSGVFLGAAGAIVNDAGGTIAGHTYGVEIVAAGTLETAGTISGGLLDAVFFDTAGATLIIHPTAVFAGTVRDGGTGGGLIELTTGTAGTLSRLGTDIIGFQTVTIDAGAAWTVGGTISGFQGVTINGFTNDDRLVLDGVGAGSTATLGADNLLTIANAQGIAVGSVQFDAGVAGQNFSLLANGQGGSTLLLCYVAQTRILTPSGEVAVEDLRIGDIVVTRWHGMQPIKWIGRQSFAERFVKGNRDRLPVRIKAGALGERLPARDLSVSPGHSMLLEDHLVLAWSLVNGVTIVQDHAGGDIHYFQIELETHDCVIANGTWSESYADCEGLREQFHNVAEFNALYPDYRPPEELALCAPRAERGARLDAVLRPVVARATTALPTGPLKGSIDRITGAWKIAGWAQNPQHPELPVLLEVLLEGKVIGSVLACDYRRDLKAAGIGQGRCSFVFTSPVRLRPEAIGSLRIRRATDGTEIRMSAACLDRIAGVEVPAAKALRLVA